MRLTLAIAMLALTVPFSFAQDVNPPRADAYADLINTDGKTIGTATFAQTPKGVLIRVSLSGLPSGMHGFHIHETGTCDPATKFESAGGHYAPGGHDHGMRSDKGQHAGDMPNQWAAADGTMTFEVLNERITLEGRDAPVLDEDGSALVIHAKADDYISQPSGDAGERLACGVIGKR